MFDAMREYITKTLEEISDNGLQKPERVLTSSQDSTITVKGGQEVLNFCSNNYLGFANDQQIIAASQQAMDTWGFGLSSVRFICGTQEIHKNLELKTSNFLGTEDTILYAACFDANGGIFEPLFGAEDAIISDELNHASIIDGIRLSKAVRYRYSHSNMDDLEEKLKASAGERFRVICTDGVFSMDGDIAKLDQICDLADTYRALVVVDDSHATGYIGKTGRGTQEHRNVMGRVDLITTTFGKALGGASGGCASGRRELISFLRQRSRPYLFSNTLAPAVAGGALRALELVDERPEAIERVKRNAQKMREGLKNAGFDILPSDTAIVALMTYDEAAAVRMADVLLQKGIYVIGFSYPVVPKGKARIRVQLSAAHTDDHILKAIDAFSATGKELSLI